MEPVTPATVWPKLKEAYESSKNSPIVEIPIIQITKDQFEIIKIIIDKMSDFFVSDKSLQRLKSTGVLKGIFHDFEVCKLSCEEANQIAELDNLKNIPILVDALKIRIKEQFDPRKIEVKINQHIVITVLVSNLKKTLFLNSTGEIVNEYPDHYYHDHSTPKNSLQRIFQTAESEYMPYFFQITRAQKMITELFTESKIREACQQISSSKRTGPHYCKVTLSFNVGEPDNPIKDCTLKEIAMVIYLIREQNIFPMLPKCKFDNLNPSSKNRKNGRPPYSLHYSGSEESKPRVIVSYKLFDDSNTKI